MRPRDQVQAVLASLPREVGVTDNAIWYHAHIIEAHVVFAAMENGRRFRNSSPTHAEREVERYARLCLDLGRYIQTMRAPALRALDFGPLRILDELVAQIETARNAEIEATNCLGAPQKELARDVAGAARAAYEEITGQKATRVIRDGQAGGPFIEYLGEIFKACGIKASPESQARAMEKKAPETGE